ncbi:MAG: hypothetical protein KC731_26435, partial [Myxococcales bacterium]|nr:hypothetical protein [Myxococcales bacterium]
LHFAVRLFVRKRDLVPVIARPLEIPFPDGTGVSLAAGASLGPPKHPWLGEPAVAASGFAFEVPLRQEDVALSYQPSAFDHDVDPPSIVTPPTAFRWRGRPFYRPSGYDRTPIIPNGEIVEMRARCVVLFLRSDTPVALDRRGGGAGGIGGLGRRREPKTVKVTHRYMRPGATVVWDDGSVAGRVRDRLRLGKQVERGGRPCWEDERLAHGGFLCLPPASIETVEEEVTVR